MAAGPPILVKGRGSGYEIEDHVSLHQAACRHRLMNSNLAFLPPAFNDPAEVSRKAEEQIMGNPRDICAQSEGLKTKQGTPAKWIG